MPIISAEPTTREAPLEDASARGKAVSFKVKIFASEDGLFTRGPAQDGDYSDAGDSVVNSADHCPDDESRDERIEKPQQAA